MLRPHGAVDTSAIRTWHGLGRRHLVSRWTTTKPDPLIEPPPARHYARIFAHDAIPCGLIPRTRDCLHGIRGLAGCARRHSPRAQRARLHRSDLCETEWFARRDGTAVTEHGPPRDSFTRIGGFASPIPRPQRRHRIGRRVVASSPLIPRSAFHIHSSARNCSALKPAVLAMYPIV